MTLTDRVRGHVPLQTGLRRVPLRTKLVASVLALVFAALTLISAASTYALHRYMIDRLDVQLSQFTETLDDLRPNERIVLPADYYVNATTMDGIGDPEDEKYDRALSPAQLPPLLKGVDQVSKHIGKAYTVNSTDGTVHWRMLVTYLSNGSVLHVGQRLVGIDDAISRLVWVDTLVGAGVLFALAAIGAAIVRQSLIPLVQIERTAAAIAAGDLTQRVPDPEPDEGEPQTELGKLSRALNAMLAQIEAAFTARALSETAARAAESQARDAAEAARASEARAVRSEGKMRQFVADASHELRTPLTSIRGFAELYRQGAVADPEDTAKILRRIEDEASRMGLLVEDLLLLARLDRERPLELAPVELPVLALDAVQAAQATAPERTIELEIRDEPERLIAYGDDARLRQVIGNLMTNALVHTPPEASVTLSLSTAEGNRAVVEIADTGPGLTPEQREHIFERFYRADEARTRRTDREATGTGLGLAIVAAIVRAHHGAVEVISEPGQGATFRVSLPALVPDET
ncbi:two-component sensor histidine kinase [Actinoplanes sp. NBRC 14428]|uniref:histidine kinase n=1 Tax=Pseudosporangium ferrugineum TaxID=439699 RepID=A0A2T0SDL2_9ACTN|nr:HAMP domain-containing sensor histidine kinase [Pseudosporangium ferrugineum]PRY31471.1 two-component system OmpR family sensor kinase [Pseudosporangium ferrugineum]BCJ54385.1 two-component sensor histidine kinase [Actinoplanes sp. NBRC 14428]